MSLCLPPGFVGHDAHSWRRPAKVTGRGPSDFLSIEMLAWPDDSISVRFWPPRLAAGIGCEADCATVDGFSAQIDRWSGFAARTETGLGTARSAGFRLRPVMVSGWIISSDRRGLAQGWAASPAALDTLRLMLRSVVVFP
ncbi:MAG: hypothetical protein ABI647_01175 [Gemmatimonadota bacterium]